MPAYTGQNIAIDLTIKVWRIPIRIKGTIEPVAIMKFLDTPPKIKSKRALSRR